MSDAKKGGGEEHAGGNLFVDGFFWFLLVLVLYTTIKGAFAFLNISFDWLPSATDISATIFNTVQVFSIFISLLFLLGIIYFNFLLGELMHHGHGHGHDDHGSHGVHGHASTGPKDSHGHAPDKRWQNVLTRLASSNESDWRLAIIESDIILADMLSRMGYHGEGIGEMLKQVEKSDFDTIDEAWEAHKVRNRIAHDGAAYKVSKHEAERVVGLYKKVFEEFYFI